MHSFESTPASLIFAGNGITGTSGALSALASSLSDLTALRILDLSGAHVLAAFSGCSHPRPDNHISGLERYCGLGDLVEMTAAAFAPFLPSLARLHDLESLNLSGAHTGAFARSLCFAAEALAFCRVVYKCLPRTRRLWFAIFSRCSTSFERSSRRIQTG